MTANVAHARGQSSVSQTERKPHSQSTVSSLPSLPIITPTGPTHLSVSKTGTSFTLASHFLLLSASSELSPPAPQTTPRARPKSEDVRLGAREWRGGGGSENQPPAVLALVAEDCWAMTGEEMEEEAVEDVVNVPEPIVEDWRRACRSGRRDSGGRYCDDGVSVATRWAYDQVMTRPSDAAPGSEEDSPVAEERRRASAPDKLEGEVCELFEPGAGRPRPMEYEGRCIECGGRPPPARAYRTGDAARAIPSPPPLLEEAVPELSLSNESVPPGKCPGGRR